MKVILETPSNLQGAPHRELRVFDEWPSDYHPPVGEVMTLGASENWVVAARACQITERGEMIVKMLLLTPPQWVAAQRQLQGGKIG